MYVSWIQGFISGKNSMNGGNKGGNTSYESLYYSVIKHCRENPMDKLDMAVNEIYYNQLYYCYQVLINLYIYYLITLK